MIIAESPVMSLYKARGLQLIGAPELLSEGSVLMSQTMRLDLGDIVSAKVAFNGCDESAIGAITGIFASVGRGLR